MVVVVAVEVVVGVSRVVLGFRVMVSCRVLTNLSKLNSQSFPGFPDPLISLFQTNIK